MKEKQMPSTSKEKKKTSPVPNKSAQEDPWNLWLMLFILKKKSKEQVRDNF